MFSMDMGKSLISLTALIAAVLDRVVDVGAKTGRRWGYSAQGYFSIGAGQIILLLTAL
jgi:hypothetical protein